MVEGAKYRGLGLEKSELVLVVCEWKISVHKKSPSARISLPVPGGDGGRLLVGEGETGGDARCGNLGSVVRKAILNFRFSEIFGASNVIGRSLGVGE